MLEVSFLTILELWKGIFTTRPYVPMSPYEFSNSLPFFIFLYHTSIIYQLYQLYQPYT